MSTASDRLNEFYRSPQGAVARDLIARRLAAHWPSLNGDTVLAYGHAHPWTDHLKAAKVTAVSPATLGLDHTSDGEPGTTVLCADSRLPFADQTFDRALLVHAVEHIADVHALLRAVWRVTTSEARILIVAANPSGLWARTKPFRYGTAMTRARLEAALVEAMFSPYSHSYALYAPPALYRHASFWETPCRALIPALGGVVLIEAHKQLCAASSTDGQRRPIRAASVPARGTPLA